jgi:predicted CopG family antitoxin
MATKTISIDLEPYERLRRARRSPDESFSSVIKRARWPNDLRTAAGLLEALEEALLPDPAAIKRLDEAQRLDIPPEDPWRFG